MTMMEIYPGLLFIEEARMELDRVTKTSHYLNSVYDYRQDEPPENIVDWDELLIGNQ